MGSEWKEVPFNELGEVNRGRSRHRPRYAEHLYGGPYPFIQTGDIRESNGRIVEHTQTYSEAGLEQSRLWPAGTMCITIAANIAETAILTYPACFPDSVVGFIADENKCDVRFIEYNFRLLKRRLQYEATGSVQDNINLATLSRLSIPLPPLPEQKAIAHILGSLDDKIELNRQMNATLEGLAQALFQSWFVDFDPVLDNALAAGNPIPDELADRAAVRRQALANGTANRAAAKPFPAAFQFTEELGWIPEGWEVKDFGDIAKNIRNSVDPKSLPEDTPYVGLEHIDRKVFSLTRWGYASEVDSQKAQFEENDFLFGKLRPYFHKICQVQTKGICSTDILVIRPKYKILSGFVGCQIFESEFVEYANLRSTGTRMPRASWKDMAKYEIPFPESDLIETFNMLVQPMRDKCKKSINESRTLTKLRDTLLPQLISGELQIPDAEKLTEDALV